MIELFSADTPNGKKIGIMLEEIKFEYKVTKVNHLEGEQFNTEFRKIGKKYFVTEKDVKSFILAQETNVGSDKTEEIDLYSGVIRED